MKRLQLLPRLPLLALAVVTALLSGAASAKQMTICGEKIDYSAAENSWTTCWAFGWGDLQAANPSLTASSICAACRFPY